MTAEFDSSRFTAVDRFFGNAERPTDKKLTESSTEDIKGRRREGVGANAKNYNGALNRQKQSLLTREVLRVGMKRYRDSPTDVPTRECDGDDFDIHDSHGANEMNDGRTSLDTNEKKKIEKYVETTKQKKKLGKKERRRQQQGASVEADANKEHQRASEISITDTDKINDTMQIGPTKNNGKRKRRKIRSRQKNIRKDNRSVVEKPSHLIPGSNNYQGRPMTQATREKLGLRKTGDSRRSTNVTAYDFSSFVIDRGQDCSKDDVGVKLAVDEFLTNIAIEKADEKNNKKTKMRQKSKSLKKKRKLFKNLV